MSSPELGTKASMNPSRFSHLYVCVSSARKLNRFSMRSLFIKIQLHPLVQPLISHSVWCHRPDIQFNAAFMIDLDKMPKVSIYNLNLDIELHTRQLQSSQQVGNTRLQMKQGDSLIRANLPIIYYFKESTVPIIDTLSSNEVGKFVVTVALGYQEHRNHVEPPIRFVSAVIKRISPGSPKERKTEEKWMIQAEKHGWMSKDFILENWEKFARDQGWYESKTNFSIENSDPLTIGLQITPQASGDLLNQPYIEDFTPEEVQRHSISLVNDTVDILPEKIKKKMRITHPITVMRKQPKSAPRFFDQYRAKIESEADFDKNVGKYIKRKNSTSFRRFQSLPRNRRSTRIPRVPTHPPLNISPKPPKRMESPNPRSIVKSPSLERILAGIEQPEGLLFHLSDFEDE